MKLLGAPCLGDDGVVHVKAKSFAAETVGWDGCTFGVQFLMEFVELPALNLRIRSVVNEASVLHVLVLVVGMRALGSGSQVAG